MIKKIGDLRVLLMQARLDQETIKEEQETFAEYAGLRRDQIDILNIFETPVFDPVMLDEYDVLFAGGSSDEGDALVRKDKPAFAIHSMHILAEAYERKMPTFAVCYGFQAAVAALGGELVHDKTRAELGTPAIHLTDAGKEDPLFKDMPTPFHAVSLHEKLAAWVPGGAMTLAENEMCPHHAFTFPDRPFYAVQFHPELDVEVLVKRVRRYQRRYGVSDEILERVVRDAQDTLHAHVLLGRFIELALTEG